MIHPERIAEVMGGATVLGREVRFFQDLESSVSGGHPSFGEVVVSDPAEVVWDAGLFHDDRLPPG